jgi:agmatinase
MRQAVKEQLVRADRTIQIGIRTFIPEGVDLKVVTAYDALDMRPSELAACIRATVGDAPVYLTFDVDALDPSQAPGTGTPVAGGLTSELALRTLWNLRDLAWCGMDVVEVSPPYDPANVTGLVAATVVQHYLQILAERKAARAP